MPPHQLVNKSQMDGLCMCLWYTAYKRMSNLYMYSHLYGQVTFTQHLL